MRKLNYSSGILVAAIAFLFSASSAFAGGANLPKGDWSVGPINAASSSGVGYCSMKNDYTDGNTLVFARDAEGSNSLAIDFHKKVMEPGGQYLVSLQVGSLQRQMMAIAATPSVFIIQMGLDRDFYTMLQRKANLLVDFQTSKMSFKLDGTKDGLAALTNCAVAVGKHKKFAQVRVPLNNAVDEADLAATEPAAGGDAPVLPAPVSQPQAAEGAPATTQNPTSGVLMGTLGNEAVKATLEAQIAALKAENRKLLAENQRVAERMQTDDSATAAAPAQGNLLPEPPETSFTGAPASDVTAALTQAQQGIQQALQASQAQADLARRQADLEAENARLKAQLDAAQAQAEAERKQAAIVAENARLKLALAEQQRQQQLQQQQLQQQQLQVQQQAAAAPSLNAAEAQAPVPKAQPAKVRILAQKDNFLGALLAQSNIESRRSRDSYAWHLEGIRGEAREEKLDDRALEEAVNDYVDHHAKSCRGDFAHTVRPVKAASGAEAMEGELACIHKDGHGDAASAVLFISRDGKLDIISQGGTPDHMEKALSARDDMVAAISE